MGSNNLASLTLLVSANTVSFFFPSQTLSVCCALQQIEEKVQMVLPQNRQNTAIIKEGRGNNRLLSAR